MFMESVGQELGTEDGTALKVWLCSLMSGASAGKTQKLRLLWGVKLGSSEDFFIQTAGPWAGRIGKPRRPTNKPPLDLSLVRLLTSMAVSGYLLSQDSRRIFPRVSPYRLHRTVLISLTSGKLQGLWQKKRAPGPHHTGDLFNGAEQLSRKTRWFLKEAILKKDSTT